MPIRLDDRPAKGVGAVRHVVCRAVVALQRRGPVEDLRRNPWQAGAAIPLRSIEGLPLRKSLSENGQALVDQEHAGRWNRSEACQVAAHRDEVAWGDDSYRLGVRRRHTTSFDIAGGETKAPSRWLGPRCAGFP